MKALYKFYWDCGRMGDLEGVFLADPVDVAEAIGKTIYFGEVLGKHSDISGELEETDIELVTDDPAVIKVIHDFKLESGHDPIVTYIDYRDEGGYGGYDD